MKERPKDKVYLTYIFDWDAFKFQKVRVKDMNHPGPYSRKKIDKNTRTFINWLMYTLELHSGIKRKDLPEGKQHNAMAITMNQFNNDRLHKLMYPLDWLNFSPIVDDYLGDDEFGIYTNRLIVDNW